jgi:thiol-disulfide isomerase/thioredoxin
MPADCEARTKPRLLYIIGAITLCLAMSGTRPAVAAGNTTLPIGASAPAISEPTASGTFDSATSAKPYVIEFFAVWCPHCQREVPVVNQLQHVDGDRADIIAIPASPFGFDKSSPLQQADVDRFDHQFGAVYRPRSAHASSTRGSGNTRAVRH